MPKTNISLNINTQSDCGNIETDTSLDIESLADLHRLLDLAGIPGAYTNTAEVSVVPVLTVSESTTEECDNEYKGSTNLKVRNPEQKINNPRFGDNSLKEEIDDFDMIDFDAPIEDSEDVDPIAVADMYHSFAKLGHNEAVARTADYFGINGDYVEKLVSNHEVYEDDLNTFEDYLKEAKTKNRNYRVVVEWSDANGSLHKDKFSIKHKTLKEATNTGIKLAKKNSKELYTGFKLLSSKAFVLK
jgi:hypothetical protein